MLETMFFQFYPHRAGARLAIFSRDQGRISQAADAIRSDVPNAAVLPLVADVAKDEDLKRVVDTTVKASSKLLSHKGVIT